MAGDGVTHKATEHGFVASHPGQSASPLLVAPTTTNEFNTLSLPLPAVACLQMADVLFEFDSSFVLPEAALILEDLPGLRKTHANKRGDKPPLGVFGHADPVGSDLYNKQLSGRRAKAIFGLLTHNVALWRSLLNDGMGGDNWRAKGAVPTMRKFLGDGAPSAEAQLIEAYMKSLFPEKLGPADFLAQGKDPKGKGDFQGCSRFNPLLTLSVDEDHNLPQQQRNRENRPNRRVVIYLFRPGSKADPDLWPCPRADDGIDGCKKQFFVTPPPGDQRRRLGDVRREHAKLADTTEDTFACAFYDEISHLSPCEQPIKPLECCPHRGVVLDNLDPLQLGRLRVTVPGLLGDVAVFAMPAVPYAGPNVGFCMLPPVGANVWVVFEAGDTDRPIWAGCFWGPGEAPAEAAQPEVKFVKTETITLTLSDTPGAGGVHLDAGAGTRFSLDTQGIVLQTAGGAKVDMSGNEVSFNQGALEVR